MNSYDKIYNLLAEVRFRKREALNPEEHKDDVFKKLWAKNPKRRSRSLVNPSWKGDAAAADKAKALRQKRLEKVEGEGWEEKRAEMAKIQLRLIAIHKAEQLRGK